MSVISQTTGPPWCCPISRPMRWQSEGRANARLAARLTGWRIDIRGDAPPPRPVGPGRSAAVWRTTITPCVIPRQIARQSGLPGDATLAVIQREAFGARRIDARG